MSSENKAKKHHYVPRCYLSKFLKGEHVYALDVKNVLSGFKERPKMRHPNNLCIDDQYYSIKPEHHGSNFRLDYYDELFVESEILHELESRYHKIFTEVTTSNALSMTDATYYCDFIIQMKIRNPYWTNEIIEKNKDNWIDQSIEQILSEKAPMNEYFNRLPEEIRQSLIEEIRAEQKSMQTFSKQMQLFGLIQRSEKAYNPRSEKYREAILNSSWMLVESPSEGPYFITSDNPGFGKTESGLIHNTCFGRNSAFFLPLSPIYCLIINGFKQDNAYSNHQSFKQCPLKKIDSKKVIQINDHTIQRINRLLIACDSWYLNKIVELNAPPKRSS